MKIAVIGMGYVGLPLALLLAKKNYVIGYVWFKEDLLYNAFMHSSRKKGISKRFFSRAIIMNSYETTKLFVKDWNVKAIRFWKKIGFIENGN